MNNVQITVQIFWMVGANRLHFGGDQNRDPDPRFLDLDLDSEIIVSHCRHLRLLPRAAKVSMSRRFLVVNLSALLSETHV